jgi:hypothetical protein
MRSTNRQFQNLHRLHIPHAFEWSLYIVNRIRIILLACEIPSAALMCFVYLAHHVSPSMKPVMLPAGVPITTFRGMLMIVFVSNPHLLVRLAKNFVHMLAKARICLKPLSHAGRTYVLLAGVCECISTNGACETAMLPAEAVSKPGQVICSPVLRNVGLLYV